jgi:orotate phosphoribosyltransferase
VAGLLVGTGAVSFRTSPFFTFTSGVESPVYVDNRRLLGFVRERRAIVEALARRAGELETPPEAIAGTATAGIPWAAWLSDTLGLPMLYVRSEAKAWGHGRAVEGSAPDGARLLLVEDLAFTGGSLATGIENLAAAGFAVSKCLTIVTYALPTTRRRFEQLRVPHASLTTIDAALDVAAGSGALGPSETEIVERWLEGQRQG